MKIKIDATIWQKIKKAAKTAKISPSELAANFIAKRVGCTCKGK